MLAARSPRNTLMYIVRRKVLQNPPSSELKIMCDVHSDDAKNIISLLLAGSGRSCAFFSHQQQYLGHYRNEHLCLSAKVDPNENREGSLAAATKTLGKVPYGEQSRKYRRTVFKHDDWVNHRSSSSRVFDNLQSLFFSGVVRQY